MTMMLSNNTFERTKVRATRSALFAAIDEAVSLLDAVKEQHWALKLKRDRALVDAGNAAGVDHLLAEFGGTGSMSALYLCRTNGHDVSERQEIEINAQLHVIRTRVHDLAAELKRQRNMV